MSADIRLQTLENNTIAVIRAITPDVTEQEIKNVLRAYGIKVGVKWGNIVSAIQSAKESGQPVLNITVAKTPSPECRVRICDQESWVEKEELEEVKKKLYRIGDVLKREAVGEPVGEGIYVASGETFMTVDPGLVSQDVFGVEVTLEEKERCFNPGSSIVRKDTMNRYELIARKSGYVVITKTGKLDIVDPFMVSEDCLEMYFRIIPVMYGLDHIIDKVFRSKASSTSKFASSTISNLTKDDIKECMAKQRYSRLLIRKGVPPVQGKDATLMYAVNTEYTFQEDESGRIDYKNFGKFKEIQKDAVIAIKTKIVPARPGVNVFGDTIRVPEANDISFNYGENIYAREEDESIYYCAARVGILIIGPNHAKITEVLTIVGDVDSHTGNLKYSRDIVITGMVNAGFKISCGGNLSIRGGVEDFVEIICKGDLQVQKGIFGESTKVLVHGDAQVGFIQNSNMRIKGSLTVREYIYNSNVFCGGKFVIEGYGLANNDRGCVVGGKISSIESMQLHSVGSLAALTFLYCGVDPEYYEKLTEAAGCAAITKKQITKYQEQLGFNLNDKNLLNRLQHLAPARREIVKENLQKLKNAIKTNAELEKSITQLKELAFTNDMEKLSIDIQNHVIPEILITMYNSKVRLSKRSSRVKYALDSGQVVCKNYN
ncbi:protein of unknown function DUF342 [Chitinispirillum alkaliphilum]|nr:protein of unknown function DUF342 [Chitinispirillum alkaliphilum]